MLRISTALFLSLSLTLVSGLAWAGAKITGLKGDVTVRGVSKQLGDTLNSGDRIHTGAKSYAVLTFDDKQTVVLKANTEFKINAYRYTPKDPAKSTSILSLFKGGLRFVSGLISKKRPQAIKIKTPVATVGVRGTDISLVTGSLYLSVANGSATMTTAAGTSTFGAGSIGFAGTAASVPAGIAASQLPASVASSFSSLGSVPAAGAGAGAGGAGGSGAGASSTGTGAGAGGGAAGGSAGAGGAAGAGAAGAGAGGLSAAGIAGAAAAAAAVAAVATSNDDETSTSTSTSTSTATSTN